MFTSIEPEKQESIVQYVPRATAVDIGKREPIPQDSQCLEDDDKNDSDNDAVPFADLLSYGTNGSPTVTMTKTLYLAGQITSTASDASTSTSGKEDGKSTTTGTSTVYNTITITSTSISTTTVHDTSSLTSLASLTSSNLISSAASSTSAKTHSATASINVTNEELPARKQGGTIAGATLGSMAAFGMIGFLIWYLCAKKNGKRKMKIKLNIKRRKSSTVKTPQLEDQSMEETRRIMLERSKNFYDFLKSSPAPSNHASAAELPGDVGVKRSASQKDSSRTHPSWIGVAMTSSTPPNTSPLPRSNSQKSATTMQSGGIAASGGHPSALKPGFGSQQQHIPASLMPTPLKPALKPAPIITNHSLARPEHVSPLSPRGMFNAVSNTTSRAWGRASQVLSPGAYQRVADDRQSGLGTPKRKDSKPRNPELEIGHQTDKTWEGKWI